jgi:twitching motility protein PilJ
MSTMMDKGRNLGTSFWLLLLLVSVAIFGLNTGFATYLGSKLAGAGSAAADLQVLSQQLANQGREAVGGDTAAFAAFSPGGRLASSSSSANGSSPSSGATCSR